MWSAVIRWTWSQRGLRVDQPLDDAACDRLDRSRVVIRYLWRSHASGCGTDQAAIVNRPAASAAAAAAGAAAAPTQTERFIDSSSSRRRRRRRWAATVNDARPHAAAPPPAGRCCVARRRAEAARLPGPADLHKFTSRHFALLSTTRLSS